MGGVLEVRPHSLIMFMQLFVALLLASNAEVIAFAEEEPVRQFNEVLEDVLDEFSYDIKTNQVPVASNLALRKINLSENVPETYERYLETVVAERMRKFSQAKVIHCSTCRTKRSIVKDGRVTVVMPINNKRALDALAREYGIESWLDVGLIYQSTSLLLAFNLFDAKTKELLWSKVYNSESLYQRFPTGVPSPELERNEDDVDLGVVQSSYIWGLSVGWSAVPNVADTSNMLAASLRFAEVFNKKRSEVGAIALPIIDTAAIIPAGKAEDTTDLEDADGVQKIEEGPVVKPFQFGLGLFASYHHNFMTDRESLDSMRPGVQVALGLVVAASYLSFTGMGGFNLRMGNSLFVEANVLYSAPTTISLTDDLEFKTKGGVGALATFGILL